MLIFDQLKRGDSRLRWLAAGVLGGMFVLIAGLWVVQIVNFKHYEKDLKTQSYRTVRLPAVRGRIMDRNGIILAESRPSYNVDLFLEDLRPYFQMQYSNSLAYAKKAKWNLNAANKAELGRFSRYAVASNLVGRVSRYLQTPLSITESEFHRHYQSRTSLPFPAAENLTPTQVARFAEMGSTLPGVNLEVQSLRYYPLHETAAHLLGRVARTDRSEDDEDIAYDYRLPDFKGIIGVEATFDEQLRGDSGGKSVLVNNLCYRQAESVWLPPSPGDDVVLTIDAGVQQAAEKSLKAQGADIRGAVVVLDVWNGDILAMASAPTFDPNDFVPSISHEEYAKLNDPETTPLINRATYAQYPPGSIFKIVVGLAALESHAVNPKEEWFSKGYYQLTPKSKPIGDTAGAGYFDFHRAFIKSSNPYFIHFGMKAGLDNILQMGQEFCLGQKTGIPTRQELSGYFPKPGTRTKYIGNAWRDGDTANLCIGQGEILVTPLQMAVMASTIANGGTVYWPRLVNRLETEDNGFRKITETFPAGRIRNQVKLDPAHLRLVQESMRDDVAAEEGTGSRAAVAGWQVCGKTGTAEIKHGRTLVKKITWFVSYAPFDAPKYAVVAMVDGGRSGGKTCAPIAKKVYEALQKMEQPKATPPLDLARTN